MRPPDTDPDMASRRTALWLLLDLLALQASVRLVFEGLSGLHPWWRASVLGRSQIRFGFEMPASIAAIVVGVLVLPLLRRVSSGEAWAALGLRRTSGAEVWAPAVVLAAVGIGIAALSGLVVPERTLDVWRSLGIETKHELFLFVVVVAPIFAALAEEVVYRGFMQSGLQRIHLGWGAVASIVVCVAAHAHQGAISVLFFVLPVTVLFTSARRLQPGLGPLMAAHLIVDIAIFAGFFLCNARPDLHVVVCGLAFVACITALLVTRRALRALLIETRAWVSTLRGEVAPHIGWVLGFVVGAAAIAVAVQQSRIHMAALAGTVLLIVVGQALRNRRESNGERVV